MTDISGRKSPARNGYHWLLAIQSGQQLSYIVPAEPQSVKLDRTLLEKSLSGLLSNAIKYAGDDAHICLTTEVTAGNVVISVKDDGIGIAEEDQKKLSTIFYREATPAILPERDWA